MSEWPVPLNYIAGLITSNDVSDLEHWIGDGLVDQDVGIKKMSDEV